MGTERARSRDFELTSPQAASAHSPERPSRSPGRFQGDGVAGRGRAVDHGQATRRRPRRGPCGRGSINIYRLPPPPRQQRSTVRVCFSPSSFSTPSTRTTRSAPCRARGSRTGGRCVDVSDARRADRPRTARLPPPPAPAAFDRQGLLSHEFFSAPSTTSTGTGRGERAAHDGRPAMGRPGRQLVAGVVWRGGGGRRCLPGW